MPCLLYTSASRAGADASVWEDDTSMKVRNYTVTDDNGEAREDVFTFGGGSWTPGKPGKYERVLEWNGNSTIDLVAYIEKTGTGFDKVELQAGDDDAVEQKADNLDGFDYLYSINYGLAKPADGKLSLEFGHVMSKIVINVKGRDLSSVEHVKMCIRDSVISDCHVVYSTGFKPEECFASEEYCRHH